MHEVIELMVQHSFFEPKFRICCITELTGNLSLLNSYYTDSRMDVIKHAD